MTPAEAAVLRRVMQARRSQAQQEIARLQSRIDVLELRNTELEEMLDRLRALCEARE